MHMHVLYILMYRYDTYLFLCGLNIIVAIVYNKNVGPAETCNTFYALRLNTSSSLSTSPPPSRLFSANVLLLVRLQRRRMANDLYHTYKQTHTHTQRDKHTRAYIRCSRFCTALFFFCSFLPSPPITPLQLVRRRLHAAATQSDVFSFCLLCVTPLHSLSFHTNTLTHARCLTHTQAETQRDRKTNRETRTHRHARSHTRNRRHTAPRRVASAI